MRKQVIVLAASVWLTGAASASEISKFFNGLNSFQGDFLQTVYQDGQLTQTSFGEVFLKKPLKFRWNYETPEPMQLVSDGKKFYHYDVELAQVTSKSVKEVAGSALATLLNGKKSIDKTFKVKTLKQSILSKKYPKFLTDWQLKASKFYQLTPKRKMDGDAQAKVIILGISDENKLTVFYVEDDYGKNSFLFDNVEQNGTIANDKFIFVAPEGVDVLGQ